MSRMEQLIEQVAGTCGVPVHRIKGQKRYGRQVSYAKMLFCWIAYDSYHIMHREIARFLECPRENVYWLIPVAKNNLEYDKEFRGLYDELVECV